MATQHHPTHSESQPAFDLLHDLIASAPEPDAAHSAARRVAQAPAGSPENDLLRQLLDAPPALSGARRRPVALRSADEQRRHALRGYRLRTWVDSALHQTERLLFVGAVLVFGYWFADGPARDWLHYQQEARTTRPAAAAPLAPLAARPTGAAAPRALRDAHDLSSLHTVPLPYVKSGPSAASTERSAPPADDFIAPRARPLDAPVVAAPPQPTHLAIPSIGLDTPVKEVFIDDGAWEVAEYAAGYLNGTGLPGDGNTVLAGHAGIRGAVFRDLGALNPNDDIYLDAAGWRYHYRVRETKSVWPEQVEVLDPSATPVLTMLTCTNWDTQRLVVVADLIDSKPSPGP
jgi:sortase A